MVVQVAIAGALAAGTVPRSASANGAFPDSYQIMLPSDAPRRIIFSTNFGIIVSDDDGATWSWTCEQEATQNAFLYQMGAPPTNQMYAISSFGLAYSTDGSCSWGFSKGRLDNATTIDSFAHPTDPDRVLAIAAERELPYAVYPSLDGGRTFGAPIYTAPVDGGLLGLEISRSDPRIITLAMFEPPGIRPRLVRSLDDGKTWEPPLDLEAQLGANWFSIVEVDPVNPRRIFFRIQEPRGETLAITEDGGATFVKPVHFDDRMTAFVQLASGTILVTGLSLTIPKGYRSIDGGKTFTPWVNVPGVRALGERAGKLYVLGDNFIDKFALAVSRDEGMTFEPLTTYGKVAAIHACAQRACEVHCETIAEKYMIWSGEMCRGMGGVDAGMTTGGAKDGGCRCGAAEATLEGGGAALLGVLAALMVSQRRRRATRAQSALTDRRPSSDRWPGG